MRVMGCHLQRSFPAFFAAPVETDRVMGILFLESFGAATPALQCLAARCELSLGSDLYWVHLLPMPRFIANADYEEKDRHPIDLKAGDEIMVGPVDRTWPGWVWAEDGQGRRGYIPEKILEPLGEGRFALMKDFDPSVLAVKRGDALESIEQIDGWHWCRHESGVEGWVAGYLLRPCE